MLVVDDARVFWGNESIDETGAAGWSIADTSRDGSGSNWDDTRVILIRVNGAAKSANNAATGAPTISGTTEVGQTC